MTQLNRDDVDLKNRECKVLGKGNKERIVYIDAVTAMTIDEYLKSNCLPLELSNRKGFKQYGEGKESEWRRYDLCSLITTT